MLKKFVFAAVILFAGAFQSAAAIELKVYSYTGSSITFSLSGAMPGTNPGTLDDGPAQIDLLYTGNLWSGGNFIGTNSLSATPFIGSGPLADGFTGGYAAVEQDYSWLLFENDLTGLQGSGQAVTLNFGSGALLDILGTGTIDLYWGNLRIGPDASGRNNILLSSVSIVDGRIVVDDGEVPEPVTLAMFGIGAASLAAARRRKPA